MIWDRFDDTHDDVRDDEFKVEKEIESLKKHLKKLNVEIPSMEEKKHHANGPHEWYKNDKNHVRALENRRGLLEQLLAKELKKKP